MERDLTLAVEETHSAVSWAAVFAGAVAALAVSIVLSLLVAGFGLKAGTPWLSTHASLSGFTPIVGALMVAVQVVSSALGGYLAGRLRSKWTGVHEDEAHFRDTAHGLLAWALSTVAGVVLAAGLLAPYADAAGTAAAAVAQVDPVQAAAAAARNADIAAQSSLFMGVGMLVSAFTASVAAALGGMRREEMHGKV